MYLPLLLAGSIVAAVAQDMAQGGAQGRLTLNVIDADTGQIIDQVEVLEEDYGAVAAWMGGRGRTAGLGLAPQLGGRFPHGLTEQEIYDLGFTFENPLAYGAAYGKGRVRKLVRKVTGYVSGGKKSSGGSSSPKKSAVQGGSKKEKSAVEGGSKKKKSAVEGGSKKGSYTQSSSSSIPQTQGSPSSFARPRPARSQSRHDVIMGLRRDLETAKSRGDFAEAAQINQELERIAGPRPS